MASRKFGWHSGTITAQDGKFRGDVYVQDDIVFSDVSAGVLGVTGGIDMQSTTSAIGIDLGGTFSTAAINIDGTTPIGIRIGTSISPLAHTTAASRALSVYTSQSVTSGTYIGAIFQVAPIATSGTADNYTINVRNSVATGKTCGGNQRGVYVETEALGTATVTGTVAALMIETYAESGTTLSGDYYGISIAHYTDKTATGTNYVIRSEFNGSGTCDAHIGFHGTVTSLLHGNSTVTNFILASASGQMGCTVSADGMTANPEADTEAGYVTIKVGANNYQIPFYAA